MKSWQIRTHRNNEVIIARDFDRAYIVAAGLKLNGDLVKVNADKNEIDIVECTHELKMPRYRQVRSLQGGTTLDISHFVCNDCGLDMGDA
jgi:hypothetical protein